MLYVALVLIVAAASILLYVAALTLSNLIGYVKSVLLKQSNAPFIPIPTKNLNQFVKHIKLNEHSIFYDLGSGNGKVIFELARQYKNSKFIGVERDCVPLLISNIHLFFKRYANVKFVHSSLFDVDLSSATHIYLYLFPGLMDDLLPKLKAELSSGTTVYSVTFKFSHIRPDQVLKTQFKSKVAEKMYVYKF